MRTQQYQQAKQKAPVSGRTREPVIQPEGELIMMYTEYHTTTDTLAPNVEAARPSWADRVLIIDGAHSEGNGEGWSFEHKRGLAEICSSYNPHTGEYTGVSGWVKQDENLTLEQMEQLAGDLLALVERVRKYVGGGL